MVADSIPNVVYLCHSGTSFATQLAELTENAGNDCTPIVAFFDVGFGNEDCPSSRRKVSRSSLPDADVCPPSPASFRRGFPFSLQSEEAYGLQLLSTVSADIQVQEGPNLVIPVAVVRSTGPVGLFSGASFIHFFTSGKNHQNP